MPERATVDFTPLKGAVLAKAVVRAADLLEIGTEELSSVVGMRAVDVSDARTGMFAFKADDDFLDSAILFVRLFRSLDAIVGGNSGVARAWLRNENLALEQTPIEKIKNVDGLRDVVAYLDAKRAII